MADNGEGQQGDGWHDDSDGWHDDGDGQHNDGSGQQGDRRHDVLATGGPLTTAGGATAAMGRKMMARRGSTMTGGMTSAMGDTTTALESRDDDGNGRHGDGRHDESDG